MDAGPFGCLGDAKIAVAAARLHRGHGSARVVRRVPWPSCLIATPSENRYMLTDLVVSCQRATEEARAGAATLHLPNWRCLAAGLLSVGQRAWLGRSQKDGLPASRGKASLNSGSKAIDSC